jgi:serine protease AprX
VLGVDGVRWSGDGVGIAVIDSGLDRGRDLDGGRTDKFFDLTTVGSDKAFDDFGHGTHVSGLIGGTGSSRRSSAWRATITASSNCATCLTTLAWRRARAACVQGARRTRRRLHEPGDRRARLHRRPQVRLKIDIVNLSLGHPVLEPAATDPLVLAVERAVRSGLIVVAAAGNYGRSPETGAVGYARHHLAGQCAVGHHRGCLRLGRHGVAIRRHDSCILVARTDLV